MHPRDRVSPLTKLFFSKFPKVHIAKYLVDHLKHRKHVKRVYKLAYWIIFKFFNRIEVIGRKNIKDIQEPFLIVENHPAGMDVIMHLSIWGHLNKNTFTFVWVGKYHPFGLTQLLMLSEMMIKSGDGSKMVQEMVDRLKFGDIVNIFPEGTFPAYVYQNSGLVQEGFTGAARVALEYEKQTGKPLTIVPVGSLGANYAYPPKEKTKRYPTAKIKVMIGKPFTLNWNDVKKFDKEEVNQNCEIIQHKIMHLVGQKKLIPNYYRRWASKQKPEKRSY